MTTRMLINATVANELRIAIVEDGELTELDIETTDQNQLRGNIYKGVIHNVEASLAACFVDIGGHKQGFLPFDEISPSLYAKKWNQGDEPRITDVIKRGQEIVVQVAKDAIGEKGATLTTYLSLPGRFTVLMPGSDANGVSRKIEDETARKKIRAIAAKIERPEDCGFIVRTAGFGQTRTAIQKDLNAAIAIYEKVTKSAGIARAPSLLYAEPDLISRTLRDFFSEEIDEVWIDTREEYEAAKSYFQELMPDQAERIQWYQNPIPIFAYHHVEEQIEATFHRQVPLPSGGSIVIDETEALVAIDVNSGRNTSERDHEDTVYKTNLEAAEEAARQLKLRDLGGIIVIDFIDMELRKNERLVEKALADASKEDKARYKISKINAQGLCVLTRQRIRQGLRRAFQRRCQVCAGTGWLRTPESHSLSLLRRVETRLAQGGVGEVRVSTHKETAEYLLNLKRPELMALERQYQCRILVSAKAEMDRNADDVHFLSKGEMLAEITDRLPPREERRLDRAAKRRKKKKQRAALEGGAPEGAQPGEPQPRTDRGDRSERRKKRRRRDRDEAQPGVGESSSDIPAEIVESDILSEQSARADQERRPRPAPRAPGRFDGTGDATFTGRPPPEVLERLRAERKARLARGTGSGRPVSGPAFTAIDASAPAFSDAGAPSEPTASAIAATSAAAGMSMPIPPEFEPPRRNIEPPPLPEEARATEVSASRDSDPAMTASAAMTANDVGADGDDLEQPKKGLLERLGIMRTPPIVPPPDGEV